MLRPLSHQAELNYSEVVNSVGKYSGCFLSHRVITRRCLVRCIVSVTGCEPFIRYTPLLNKVASAWVWWPSGLTIAFSAAQVCEVVRLDTKVYVC